MALTFSNLQYEYVSDRIRVRGTIVMTAGGGTVTAADLGLSIVDEFRADPAEGYVMQYSSGSLLAMYGNYDAADGPLINDTSGTPTMTFEALGV